MRLVSELGACQAVLPPQPRPSMAALRQLGFIGSTARILEQARQHPELLAAVSSASAMWTANAATVTPSEDSGDGRVHLSAANLSSMLHRSFEAEQTWRTLNAIFASADRFCVHRPLPAALADEGAANHTRIVGNGGVLHLFGWGRSVFTKHPAPERYPARQCKEASEAVARRHGIEDHALFWQQLPSGIDNGAFHSDVLMVGYRNLLLLHEQAFCELPGFLSTLRTRIGDNLIVELATDAELPISEAVAAYPFNSQIIETRKDHWTIVAPQESEGQPRAKAYLDRVVDADNPVKDIRYARVNGSMENGGGPACLRLRVELSEEERSALGARVFLDAHLYASLKDWIERHYPDRLNEPADPQAYDLQCRALDELTQLLELGSIYDFQKSSMA